MKISKQVKIGLVIGVGFVLILVLIKGVQIFIMSGQAHQMPPTTVTSFVAKKATWPLSLKSIATVSPIQGVMISSEVSGQVSKIHFKSGSNVKKGDLLLELDASVEEAELSGALAQLELASLDAKRQISLREKNANSQTDLDNSKAKEKSALAEVARLKALIAKKKIEAPFSGKAGIRRVNLGEVLSAGQEIVSINQIDNLYLDFSLPQDALVGVKVGSDVEFVVDGFSQIFLAKLAAIESRVEEETRNIWLQAVFDNVDRKILPGMFATAHLILNKEETVTAIPLSSINYAPYGDSVYLILPEETANTPRAIRAQTVKLGRKLGDMVSVLSGLAEGDEIVSSGTFMLRPDVKVVVNNEVTPGDKTNPSPKDS